MPPHPAPPFQLLFGSLALVMMGVKRTSDRRDTQLHHGSWLIKAALWTVCILLPFLLPPSVINAYCESTLG